MSFQRGRLEFSRKRSGQMHVDGDPPEELPRAMASLKIRRASRASSFEWLGNASELPRSASTSPRSGRRLPRSVSFSPSGVSG
jgi:hypothetical protein